MFSTIGYWICIPFAALLRLFYNLTGSYGVALILFTLVLKLIMLPFQMKSKKSMIRMNRMSSKMQEIQKKYANNQIKMQEEIQKLYAEQGVNPMSGCLWSFIPMPILIALYAIIRKPITYFMMLSTDVVDKALEVLSSMGQPILNNAGEAILSYTGLNAYGEISLVNQINTLVPDFASANNIDGWINVNYKFLGMDLTSNPTAAFQMLKSGFSMAAIGLILMPFIAAGVQFLMSKFMMKGTPSEGAAAASNKMMIYMMPLMTLWIGFSLPSALCVYWIAQSAFSAVQEAVLGKFYTGKLEEEENLRQQQIEENRRKRQEEAKRLQQERKQQPEVKLSLKEKKRLAQEAKQKPKKASTTEAGRVGDRPYARGRSYREDRYDTDK